MFGYLMLCQLQYEYKVDICAWRNSSKLVTGIKVKLNVKKVKAIPVTDHGSP
jgi:hypothetical protein